MLDILMTELVFFQTYHLEFCASNKQTSKDLQYLNDCMGKHIKAVDVNAIDEPDLKVDWTSLLMLLEGITLGS